MDRMAAGCLPVPSSAHACQGWWLFLLGSLVCSRLLRRQSDDSVPRHPADPAQLFLDLTAFESSSLIRTFLATSTISFYHGEGAAEIEATLRRKVAAMVSRNPWLNGTLVSTSEGVQLAYKGKPVKKSVFTAVTDKSLRSTLPHEEIMERVLPNTVKRGELCVDREEEPLFRVTLIRTAEKEIAVVCSTSHVICDGHDFYKLLTMLDENTPARALTAQRVTGIDDAALDLISRDASDPYDLFKWISSLAFVLRKLFLAAFAPYHRSCLLEVNLDWIAEQKRAVQPSADVPYVTTNDVVCSTLLKLCGAGVGAIPYNYRGRITGLTEDHVGNYGGILGLQPPDFTDPGTIRKSMKSFYRAISGPMPGPFRSLFTDFAIVTNWAGFYREVSFKNCALCLHLPVKDKRGHTADTWSVIFMLSSERIGVLLYSRFVNMDSLKRHPAFKVLEGIS